MTGVSFDVIGLPAAQGSKKHVGNGVMVESSKALRPWRDSVTAAAMAAHSGPALDGALYLDVVFRFPCPTSRSKSHRVAAASPGGALKTTAPDLDKLVRAVGDALTHAGVIADDARICSIATEKVEVTGWTGAHIEVWEV